jgi:anaerobic selenocysteine-containing dehydrogenase
MKRRDVLKAAGITMAAAAVGAQASTTNAVMNRM